ncbi:hypothetical protein [Streptomyces sp. NPDC088762]|uniref:hypothetical protein n=1 Tax=Streptomyces sp. NPDC088762 TaxID=3365891 RepID=UPI003801BD40
MRAREIKYEAKFRAGYLLRDILNGWEPEELIEEHGQETVDRIAEEIHVIADRLIKQGGGTA